MDYMEAISYINSIESYGSKLGLDNIARLLERMDNPQDKLKFVHVAGTNGKGSTVAYLSNILTCSGYKTGTFTSPYINCFEEQIKIDNNMIDEDSLAEIVDYISKIINKMVSDNHPHPTQFEVTCAIAFEYFYRKQCDIVVLEVGLGGREDATNVIGTPLAAVITTISLDHTDRLGKTLLDIAYHKAGIIKAKTDVVLYPQNHDVYQYFTKVCQQMGCLQHDINTDRVNQNFADFNGQQFSFEDRKDLRISMLGQHQMLNAATAIKTCDVLNSKGFDITESAIYEGLLKTNWPGRLEIISTKPIILVDGAHNIEGAISLKNALDEYFKDIQKIYIVGFLRDKQYIDITRTIACKDDFIITITPKNERAISSHDLSCVLKNDYSNIVDGMNAENALKVALIHADNQNKMICVFGSLYLQNDIKVAWNNIHGRSQGNGY